MAKISCGLAKSTCTHWTPRRSMTMFSSSACFSPSVTLASSSGPALVALLVTFLCRATLVTPAGARKGGRLVVWLIGSMAGSGFSLEGVPLKASAGKLMSSGTRFCAREQELPPSQARPSIKQSDKRRQRWFWIIPFIVLIKPNRRRMTSYFVLLCWRKASICSGWVRQKRTSLEKTCSVSGLRWCSMASTSSRTVPGLRPSRLSNSVRV